MTNYTFSQLIDFTRTTPGTFVGSNGLIQTTPQSRNLLTFTQEFDNAAWTKTAATVTANSTAAPDGTPTADTLTATAGTGVIPRVADTSVNTANGLANTASIYVKAGTYTFFQIYLNSQASEWANFTLTGAGTATANGASTATITALSNGWYRCSITYTAGGTDRRPFFMLAASGTATRAQTWNPVGTETIFIWGAQLEQASTASDYTRNVGGLFPPRFDYDPVTLAPRGILIEEQRVNLLTYSEDFTNVVWTKGAGTSVTANATTAPDGTTTADRWIKDSGTTGAADLYRDMVVATLNTAHSFSFYAKANGIPAVRVTGGGSYSPNGLSRFNLELGTVAAGTGAIQSVGNGWYRCTVFITRTGTSDNVVYIAPCNADGTFPVGNGTSGIFIWGAQLEAGAFATSYIQTVAGQVTRAPDQASIVAPMFAPWYNQSEGTFVAEFQTLQAGTVALTSYVLALDSNANKRVIYLGQGSDVTATFDGTTIISATGDATGTVAKTASAYNPSGRAITSNGNTVTTGAVAAGYSSGTSLSIGNITSAGFLNGHIRRVTYYPVRLSDLQLQALSQ